MPMLDEERLFSAFRNRHWLGNTYAHNLFFDIANGTPKGVPTVANYGLRVPKRRDLLREFYVALLRLLRCVTAGAPRGLGRQERFSGR